MDGTLNKPLTSVVETAIILASSGVFTLGGRQKEAGLGALTRVGGLTLFQRAIVAADFQKSHTLPSTIIVNGKDFTEGNDSLVSNGHHTFFRCLLDRFIHE